MRKLIVALAALALVLATPAGFRPAFAHGGQYRGPAGEVPPDSRQPEDPPPPDTGGGTPTPPDGGGGTPTPPGGGDGTPTPPDSGGTPEPPPDGGGGVPAPGSGGGPGTKTGGKVQGKKGPSYESWLFWWNYNKDEILNIKSMVRGGAQRSGGGLSTTVSSGNENETAAQDVTARAVETQVVPVLRQYAEDSKVNFDIQSAAVIGLAKIGRKEFAGLMMKMAKNEGEQYHKVVEESAALALGILQERNDSVRDFLGEVATNRAAKVRTRCFAAFALGLLGDRDAAPGANAKTLGVLKSMVTADEPSRDIANSALVAIGLLGDPAAIPDLISWLNDEKAGTQKLNDINLSYAAAALGKIGQPGLAGPESREVLDAMRDQLKKKNRMTRYSTIIALGQIGPQCGEKLKADCVSTLIQVIKSEGKQGIDTQSVNFALTSLGRIAGVAPGADGKGGCPASIRSKALAQLMDTFQGKGQTRPFAALGLGLLARELPEPEKLPVAEVVRNTLAKAGGDVEARGALVISLGLLKDIQSAPVLTALLQDKGLDKKLRGTAAVALGMIGERGALETVRKVLQEKEDRDLRVDAAVAAGLLRDTDAVKYLVETLRDPKASQFILGSVATALGQIGDQRALDPLTQILGDSQYPDLTRALAAVALGQIGDRADVPVLSRVSKDVNYRAYYDAIGELLTII